MKRLLLSRLAGRAGLVLAAAMLAACNSVLGIQEAKLDPGDGGAGGGETGGSTGTGTSATEGGTGGDTGAATGADAATAGDDAAAGEAGALKTCLAIVGGTQNDCNDCVATHCCLEYDACIRDGQCSDDIAAFDECIGRYDVDAGPGACTDILTGSSASLSQALARCVERNCTSPCMGGKAIGDLCISYCSCMQIYCPTTTVPGGATCAEACGPWTQDQKGCRNYHCSLAASGIHSGNGVGPHCQHSIGLLGVCP